MSRQEFLCVSDLEALDKVVRKPRDPLIQPALNCAIILGRCLYVFSSWNSQHYFQKLSLKKLTLRSQHISTFLMCSFQYYKTVYPKKSIWKVNFIFALPSKVISDGISVHFGLQMLPASWYKWLMKALGFFLCRCFFSQHTGRVGCRSWKNENIPAGLNCS